MRQFIAAVTFALLVSLAPHLDQATTTTQAVDLTPTGSSSYATTTAESVAPLAAPRTVRQKGRITKVVDGDTVDVRLTRSRRTIRVRMIGIDTPEVHGQVECGGPKASRWLKKRLPRGTKVRLASDSTQDRSDHYGRALRYVIRAKDGKDMNRAQVRVGNAEVYVFDRTSPFKRVAKYRASERRAKKARRGIWSC
ncbi:thermonuclease family protein [Nocardioides gilvus]|uniref:thermonuclease family protein n=1 Tax=Nocardioides gilvus TaxID=1735589 RepID=UPI0013A55554|nr:thermonuclease family protein [Nocardioides gilvus]